MADRRIRTILEAQADSLIKGLRDSARAAKDTAGDLEDLEKRAKALDSLKAKVQVEADADNRVSDIHVWRVGGRSLSVILSVVTHEPRPPEHYKNLLAGYPDVEHVTVEVIACEGESCLIRKPHGS